MELDRLAFDPQPAGVIAGGIGEVLGEGDERALVGPAAQHGDRLEAAIGVHVLGRRRRLEELARRRKALGVDLVLAEALVALKADEHAILCRVAVQHGETLRVAIAVAGHGLARHRLQRPELHLLHALEASPGVGERARHPGAGIRYSEKVLAASVQGETRPTAEIF